MAREENYVFWTRSRVAFSLCVARSSARLSSAWRQPLTSSRIMLLGLNFLLFPATMISIKTSTKRVLSSSGLSPFFVACVLILGRFFGIGFGAGRVPTNLRFRSPLRRASSISNAGAAEAPTRDSSVALISAHSSATTDPALEKASACVVK